MVKKNKKKVRKKRSVEKGLDSSMLIKLAVVAVVLVVVYSQTSFFDFLKQSEDLVVEEEVPEVPEETWYSGGGGGSRPAVAPEPEEVVFDWCYQESPNVINQTGIDGDCGLDYRGDFSSSNGEYWDNFSALNDGDWVTNASALEEITPWAEAVMTYYKPEGAINESLLKVKHGDVYDYFNIPSSCWDYLPTMVHFTMVSRTNDANYYSAFHCYNGTHYPTMSGSSLNGVVFEEGMLWAFPEGYLEFPEEEY